jgi:outer membrane protein assembly factor BamB
MNLAPVLGTQDDVLAIHNNRLIKFDIAGRRIGFELADGFSGQPSVAKDVIYAINRGGLEARNETDGALLWRWIPPSGSVTEHVIVTDSHVLTRTGTHTYALDVRSGQQEWSYPEAGHMALGNDTLYIASKGTVTAIAMPGFIPSPATQLEIVGPTSVVEYSTVEYTAKVSYADGCVRDRTLLTEWSLTPELSASIDAHGVLTVGELPTPTESIEIQASYVESGIEVSDTLAVDLNIGVTNYEFVYRNIAAATDAKRRAIEALEEAERRESAAIAVIEEQAANSRGAKNWIMKFLTKLQQTLFWTTSAKESAERSVEE